MRFTAEDFPPDKIAEWHDDLSQLPGVRRVSVTPEDLLKDIDDYAFDPEIADLNKEIGYTVHVEAVADDGTSRDPILKYCKVNIPSYDTPLSGLSIIAPEKWSYAASLVNGRDIMDFFVGSNHLLQAAHNTQESWRAAKRRSGAYRGYGEQRTKVQDLTPAQRAELGIPANAAETDDVFHPLDKPFIELDPLTQNKNIVPMASVCLALGDFLIDETSRIEDVDDVIARLSKRTSRESQALLNMVTHVGWMASDMTLGGRPWGPALENYHIYNRLTSDVQDLDEDAAAAPITYLRSKLSPIFSAYDVMRDTIIRQNGPYEDWWHKEEALLKAAAGWMIGRSMVPLKNDENGDIPSFFAEAQKYYGQRTDAYTWHGIENELPLIVDSLQSRGHIIQNKEGGWELTASGRQRYDAFQLQSVKKVNRLEEYVATYDDFKAKYFEAA